MEITMYSLQNGNRITKMFLYIIYTENKTVLLHKKNKRTNYLNDLFYLKKSYYKIRGTY